MIDRKVQTKIHHRIAIHNGTVYIGGVVASDKTQDMGGQTREICDKLDELLAEAGSSKEKILQAMIYSADFAQKDALNAVWTDWIAPEHLPTRAYIGGAELPEGNLVEIVVIAAL